MYFGDTMNAPDLSPFKVNVLCFLIIATVSN